MRVGRRSLGLGLGLAAFALSACGSGTTRDTEPAPVPVASGTGTTPTSPPPPPPPPPPTSNIKHVVVLVQENHTFDAYFGRWCTAAPGSSPTCTAGPSCCEAAPETDPSGAAPTPLDDAENSVYDPNHTQACELSEMNGGKMDRYVTGASCSNAKNFAIATDAVIAPYHDLAAKYAIADRYFQPIVGQSSSNDMYLAVASYVFTDNDEEPQTNGHGCSINRTTTLYTGKKTVGDVLLGAQKSFAWYAEGYQAMKDALICPPAPPDCPAHIPTAPCVYDPADVPFEYYAQFADDPKTMKDYDTFTKDVASHSLPSVAFVKPLLYKTEHPGYGTTISAGTTFVKSAIDLVLGSPYADDTLVLLTWDEGGGYFDHVAPPAASAADFQPYGTRIPLLAIGKFAKKGFVSHVVMEHSSIVKFIEWNFTGATGQLGTRDTLVNGIGSLLDPNATGLPVPE